NVRAPAHRAAGLQEPRQYHQPGRHHRERRCAQRPFRRQRALVHRPHVLPAVGAGPEGKDQRLWIMKAVNAAGIALVALLSHGCVREEIAVPAQPRYAVECVARVGPTYDHQLWFDLSSYSVVAQNSKMDWDLAFESAPEGWRVRLNQARLMRAHRAWEDAIGQPGDTAGFGNTWRVDLPSGRPDSVAIPDWRNDQPVFILNLGYGTAGQMLGLRKLQITSVDASAYQFTLAHMDGSNVQHHSVQKDPARAYTHFSISNGTVVIAPP